MNKLRAFLVLGLLCFVHLSIASAADENFDVYVFADVTYDDNVFRVANDAEALTQTGSTTQDDIETTFGVGVDLRIPVSRQQFNFDAELRRTRFDRFDQLNNNNGRLSGEWEWAFASRASGNLGYVYEQELTEFFEFTEAVEDTEENQNFFVSARVPIHPRWTVIVGGDFASVDFDYVF